MSLMKMTNIVKNLSKQKFIFFSFTLAQLRNYSDLDVRKIYGLFMNFSTQELFSSRWTGTSLRSEFGLTEQNCFLFELTTFRRPVKK